VFCKGNVGQREREHRDTETIGLVGQDFAMVGGDSEHFCLRWNDFESNISQAFQTLREDKDFFDVTIACEDEQVQAHKVILSACSPFFKKILRKNPHQHPLLFLKGVKYVEIVAILNFMYHGEVNVTQDDLNAFLAVAEELKVKGLTQSDQQTHSEQAKVQPQARRVREPPDLSERPAKKRMMVPEIESITTAPVKTEPLAAADVLVDVEEDVVYSGGSSMVAQGSSHETETYDDQKYYSGYENEEEDITAQFDANSQALRPEGNKGDFRDGLLGHLMVKVFRPELGGNLWSCTVCSKVHKSKTLIRDHVEAQHFKNIDYSCDHCGKVYKTRDSFKKHVAVHKRNPGFHGRGAYNSAVRTEHMAEHEDRLDVCMETQSNTQEV